VFIAKPITLVLMIVCIVLLVMPLVKPVIGKYLKKDKAV